MIEVRRTVIFFAYSYISFSQTAVYSSGNFHTTFTFLRGGVKLVRKQIQRKV